MTEEQTKQMEGSIQAVEQEETKRTSLGKTKAIQRYNHKDFILEEFIEDRHGNSARFTEMMGKIITFAEMMPEGRKFRVELKADFFDFMLKRIRNYLENIERDYLMDKIDFVAKEDK